jgi:RNA polymerase sigma-70 factor, ECF subfamily
MMSFDEHAPAELPDWSQLLGAVAAHRDRAAFSQLFEHFAPRVKGFMRRSGLSDGAAEELAQETLITVWRKAALFDPASTGPSAWIFTIARNLRIDALRRERRSASNDTSDIDSEFLLDETPHADAIVEATQSDNRVRAALAELSEEQRRVVELSFYQEKAHAEIAAELEIPLGTVKSRLRLAMNKLRGFLDDLS